MYHWRHTTPPVYLQGSHRLVGQIKRALSVLEVPKFKLPRNLKKLHTFLRQNLLMFLTRPARKCGAGSFDASVLLVDISNYLSA